MSTKNDERHEPLYDDPVVTKTDRTTWKHGSVLDTSRERIAKMVAKKEQVSLRLDRDLLDAYKELAQDGSYQQLIHHALRQWLEAQGVTQMVCDEILDELRELKKLSSAS